MNINSVSQQMMKIRSRSSVIQQTNPEINRLLAAVQTNSVNGVIEMFQSWFLLMLQPIEQEVKSTGGTDAVNNMSEGFLLNF